MWPDAETTRELLGAVGRGDAAARERLLSRHRDALRRMIDLRMDPVLQRRVDASDIVQDVLVEADRRLATYIAQAPMPFHLWLRQLATDRLVDAHRRHRVAARRSLDREQRLAAPNADDTSVLDLFAMIRDRQLTPAAQLIQQELAEAFRAAIDRLDEADREILLMRHFEQLSNKETAAALGLSEPAAGMRYLRAIRRLKEYLSGSECQEL